MKELSIWKNNIWMLSTSHRFERNYVEMITDIPSEYVRIQYLYCGICGSDMSYYLGHRTYDAPISLGHEFVAQVMKVGADVIGFNEGEYVVSDLNYRCGECGFCKSARSHLCVRNGEGHFTNRAFALYGDIHYSYLVKAPARKSALASTLIEPLSCIMHGVDQIRTHIHDSVLIMGCGNLGTCLAFYLKKLLCIPNVYVNDPNKARMYAICSCFDVLPYDGTICDVVFDATGTVQGTISSINNTQLSQRICSFSHLYGYPGRELVYDMLCKHEIDIHFPLRNGEKGNLQRAADFIGEFWNPMHDTALFELFPIDNLNQAFSERVNSTKCKCVVVCH